MPPKSTNYTGEMRLYSPDGSRYYLTESERARFIETVKHMPPMARLFCLTLVYTGCRISEARFMRRGDVQLKDHRVVLKTLKRRTSGHVREVPIPDILVEEFLRLHFAQMLVHLGHELDEMRIAVDHRVIPTLHLKRHSIYNDTPSAATLHLQRHSMYNDTSSVMTLHLKRHSIYNDTTSTTTLHLQRHSIYNDTPSTTTLHLQRHSI